MKPTRKLNKEELAEMQHLVEMLVNEAVLWESTVHGTEYASLSVYGMDDEGGYIARMPATDELDYVLGRLRELVNTNKKREIHA